MHIFRVTKIKIRKLLLLISIILSALYFVGEQNELILADTDIEDNRPISYLRNPSPDPVRGWIGWKNGGFTKQPPLNLFVKRDSIVTVDTNTVRSLLSYSFNPFESNYQQWYTYTGKKNPIYLANNHGWQKYGKEISGSKPFLVPTNLVGTKYYQLKDWYSVFKFTLDTFYSNIMAVHVLPNDVDARSLELKSDSESIFNFKDTSSDDSIFDINAYLTALPHPDDTTKKVNWTLRDVGDKDTDDINGLASITQDGQVIANTIHRTGIINVTGYIKNSDGLIIKESIPINIINAIDDQESRVGKTATFNINLGQEMNRDDELDHVTVNWYYRDSKNVGHLIVTKKANEPGAFSYTTEPLTMDHNGRRYFAEITMEMDKTNKKPDKNKSKFTTNDASLTVLPPIDTYIDIQSYIKNELAPDKNDTQDNLYNVIKGDPISYGISIFNNSSKDLTNSALKIPLLPHTKIYSVSINGNKTNNYIFSEDDSKLRIPIPTFKSQEQIIINLKTTTPEISSKRSFAAKPILTGEYGDDNSEFESNGDEWRINYITNILSITPQNIEFQPILMFENNVLKYRSDKTNEPNPIVVVDDQRKNKSSKKLSLSQTTDFTANGTNSNLPVSLRYYSDDENSFKNILHSKVKIATSELGQKMKSIFWKRNKGLLLHVDSNDLIAGNYQANLTWTIEDTL